MNYYIIPKNNFTVQFQLELTNEKIKPYISYSLIFYLNDILNQMIKIDDIGNKIIDLDNDNNCDNDIDKTTLDYINKMVNPLEFIHTNVPGSLISVSKVKPEANIFFELLEVFQLFGINDLLSSKDKLNIAHLTPNFTSTCYLLNMLREDHNDNVICEIFNYAKLFDMFITNKYSDKLDLLICEFEMYDYAYTNKYTNNLLLVFCIILKYQSNQGTCIIKLDNIFYKSIVDIIFILSKLYDKVFLIKPSTSNVTKGDRYIICKSFNSMGEEINLVNEVESKIINVITKEPCFTFKSLINNEIPCYFLSKLEELNATIGQQQLEAYDQIINIYKNKNRDEKIEVLKRNHIQKCIQWCEKNQLPHNKFIDKVNIFLTPKKNEEDNVFMEPLNKDEPLEDIEQNNN